MEKNGKMENLFYKRKNMGLLTRKSFDIQNFDSEKIRGILLQEYNAE